MKLEEILGRTGGWSNSRVIYVVFLGQGDFGIVRVQSTDTGSFEGTKIYQDLEASAKFLAYWDSMTDESYGGIPDIFDVESIDFTVPVDDIQDIAQEHLIRMILENGTDHGTMVA